MRRWQDPRLGTYKSAVQKYIRRGEIDAAVGAADALLRLPGGRSSLSRRLSVIAAEDVGAKWIPAVVGVTRKVAKRTGPDDLDHELIEVTAGLASVPKSKAAYWLAATCWEGRRIAAALDRAAMGNAIDRGDYREALAIYITARDGRRWRSGERVIEALLERARVAPPLAAEIALSALWREGQGGFGVDELAATAIIALVDLPDGPVPDLPGVAHALPDPHRTLDWYVYDSHTAIGQRVIGRVARRHGLRPETLAWLQFNEESIRLGPAELPARWRTQALDLDAVAGGWGSPTEGRALWNRLRDEVRSEIEWEVSG